jgi:hypothetical protein
MRECRAAADAESTTNLNAFRNINLMMKTTRQLMLLIASSDYQLSERLGIVRKSRARQKALILEFG